MSIVSSSGVGACSRRPRVRLSIGRRAIVWNRRTRRTDSSDGQTEAKINLRPATERGRMRTAPEKRWPVAKSQRTAAAATESAFFQAVRLWEARFHFDRLRANGSPSWATIELLLTSRPPITIRFFKRLPVGKCCRFRDLPVGRLPSAAPS